MRPGPHNDLTDVAGLAVGCAHDERVMTGVTVILPAERANCAVDVRGGGPGARETDALQPGNLVEAVDAVVLAGGSVYGLGAADAVTAALGAAGKGYALRDAPGVPRSPVVPAAILYDLANGGDKNWGDAPPYARLGREAFERAERALSDRAREAPGSASAPQGARSWSAVPLGNAGAGYGALAGALKGGQGSASIRLEGGATVAALACVNAFGSATMPGSRAFWAWPFEIDGEFGAVAPERGAIARDLWDGTKLAGEPRANTTLAVVATDADLARQDLKRIAHMASAGFARALRPVFSPFDGDIVFVLSTARAQAAEPRALMVAQLGALAADCVARAIARGVHAADPIGAHRAWKDLG
jgi:L-aminopeptidase/D-esterase-like protein